MNEVYVETSPGILRGTGKTQLGMVRVSLELERLKQQIDRIWYNAACEAYKRVRGRLPCGRARTTRLKKKRRKIVLQWFAQYITNNPQHHPKIHVINKSRAMGLTELSRKIAANHLPKDTGRLRRSILYPYQNRMVELATRTLYVIGDV